MMYLPLLKTKSPKLFPGPQIRPQRHRYRLLEAFCMLIGYSCSVVWGIICFIYY